MYLIITAIFVHFGVLYICKEAGGGLRHGFDYINGMLMLFGMYLLN